MLPWHRGPGFDGQETSVGEPRPSRPASAVIGSLDDSISCFFPLEEKLIFIELYV